MRRTGVPFVTLNSGARMPMVGFGTYRIAPAETENAVLNALEVGYRLIDTAQCYANEEAVGRAIASSPVAREEVFVTTKTWTNGYADTARSIDQSLHDLRTDYVDLLLIHEPSGDIPRIYRALEEAYGCGKARSIGLSNFMGESLNGVLANARVRPAVNQVETHPLRQQKALQEECDAHGIVMQSWSPLVAGRKGVLENASLASIANAHGKSPAQVILRWLVQRGVPVVVKSRDIGHMEENLELFDFSLADEEMGSIDALDTGRSQFGWW